MENDSVHQDSSENDVRIVNFTTSKNRVVKRRMFPHQTFLNSSRSLLIGRITTILITYW